MLGACAIIRASIGFVEVVTQSISDGQIRNELVESVAVGVEFFRRCILRLSLRLQRLPRVSIIYVGVSTESIVDSCFVLWTLNSSVGVCFSLSHEPAVTADVYRAWTRCIVGRISRHPEFLFSNL